MNEALFSSDLWEAALEKYASAVRLTVNLFDADGSGVVGPVHPTPLFQLFHDHGYDPGIFSECARRCIAQTDRRPAVLVSHFQGLAVVGASLALDDRIVGAAVAGYAFVDFSQVSEIQRLAREAGISFEALWHIARTQAPVPQGRLVVQGELLQVLGDSLIRENYRARQYQQAAAIVEFSDDAIIGKDLNGIITSWNRGAEHLFGYAAQETIGQPITQLIPPDRLDEEPGILDRIRRGQSIDHYETVRRRKDGILLDISLTVSPIADARGRIVGASKIARDITERKRADEHTKLLLREVSHRAKNLLAVVQSVARLTGGVDDPKAFAERFSARLAGLAASQELLIQSDWRGVDVGDLVRAQLSHFRDLLGSRIALDGPSIQVSPPAAQTLGMAILELATNASKYGALSNNEGTVRVSWGVTANGGFPRYHMSWRERGGPPVAKPERQGFGHTVIVQMVEHALDAEVAVDHASAGLDWQMSAPSAAVVENPAGTIAMTR